MAKGSTEAQAFLAQFRSLFDFATAAADMQPLEDTVTNLKAEVQQLGKNRQTIQDELTEIQKQIDIQLKVKADLEEEIEKIRSTASVERDEIIRMANKQADEIKAKAVVDADLDVEEAKKELQLALTELGDTMAAIKSGQSELTDIEKAIADLKKKFED